MTRTVETRRVILVKTRWGYDSEPKPLFFYQRKADKSNNYDHKGTSLRGQDGWAGVEDIRDATDLAAMDIKRAMTLFFRVKEALDPSDSVDLVDLVLTMVATPVDFDPEDQREHLREKALKKLTQDEIIALGIQNLAIYDKVKNHNT